MMNHLVLGPICGTLHILSIFRSTKLAWPHRQEDQDTVPLPKGTAVKAWPKGDIFCVFFWVNPAWVVFFLTNRGNADWILCSKRQHIQVFFVFLYEDIWKIGHAFGFITSIPSRIKSQQVRSRVYSVCKDRFSHFKFPDSRRLGTSDSTMHLAVAQPGSEALMNSPNLKRMQPWEVLLAKHGNNLVPLVPSTNMFAIFNSLVQPKNATAKLQTLISVATSELIWVWHSLCQENGGAGLWVDALRIPTCRLGFSIS